MRKIMFTPEERRERIDRMRRFPAELEAVVKDLSEAELKTHFIEGEWTVAQNVHHVADSHMNAYIRFKLLKTENNPTIRGYNQDDWAVLYDASEPPLETSLAIIKALHVRWVIFLESLSEDDWARTGFHPESGPISMESLLKTYSEHGPGHIDQINRTLAAGRKTAS
jgi:hypothetical protein